MLLEGILYLYLDSCYWEFEIYLDGYIEYINLKRDLKCCCEYCGLILREYYLWIYWFWILF